MTTLLEFSIETVGKSRFTKEKGIWETFCFYAEHRIKDTAQNYESIENFPEQAEKFEEYIRDNQVVFDTCLSSIIGGRDFKEVLSLEQQQFIGEVQKKNPKDWAEQDKFNNFYNWFFDNVK